MEIRLRMFSISALVTLVILIATLISFHLFLPQPDGDWSGGYAMAIFLYYHITIAILCIVGDVFFYLKTKNLEDVFINTILTVGVGWTILAVILLFGFVKQQGELSKSYPSCLEFVKEANVSESGSMSADYCDTYKN